MGPSAAATARPAAARPGAGLSAARPRLCSAVSAAATRRPSSSPSGTLAGRRRGRRFGRVEIQLFDELRKTRRQHTDMQHSILPSKQKTTHTHTHTQCTETHAYTIPRPPGRSNCLDLNGAA